MLPRLPCWLADRPALRGWLSRVLLPLLCALLLIGLTPTSGARLELCNTTAAAAAPASGPATVARDSDACDGACDDDCGTHGCTPLQHHCKCCAGATAVLPRLPAPPDLQVAVLHDRARYPRLGVHGPQRATPPPVRPPIV